MKKIFLAIIATAVALGFTACNPGTADVKWTRTDSVSTPALQDIQWLNSGAVDQQWSEPLTNAGDDTSILEVTELTGYGECIDASLISYELTVDAGSPGVKGTQGLSITLEEGATADLQITTAASK